MEELIRMSGIRKTYDGKRYVLDGTEFTLGRGEAAVIGFIFQSYCLIDSLSVKENVLMPFLYNGLPVDKKLMGELERLLEELNMTALRDKKASLLSGGERQRVAICRAILKKPKLVIADEPTGNLDDANTELVVRAFDRIVEDGTSLIVVTHNRNLSIGGGKKYSLGGGVLLAV